MRAILAAVLVSFMAMAPSAFAGDCGCKGKGAKCECEKDCKCESCAKDGKTCEHKKEEKK